MSYCFAPVVHIQNIVVVLFVAPAPDVHLLSLFDEIIPEIGVCHGDDGFAFLPCGQSLEVYFAVLGHKIMDVGACICNDRSWVQRRKNP